LLGGLIPAAGGGSQQGNDAGRVKQDGSGHWLPRKGEVDTRRSGAAS
jgi:hypothetical protein